MPASSALRGRAELALAVLVVALGGLVLFDTARLDVPATSGVIGPKFFPVAVGILLLAVGCWLAIDVVRGGHGEPEAEEDIDPHASSDWQTLALVTAAFAAHILLLGLTGWPIAGAVLFWGVAAALGARNLLRAAAIAVVLALVVFLVFDRALGVPLPAGVLEGVL